MIDKDKDSTVAGGVLQPTHGMETDQRQITAGYETGSAHRDTTTTGSGYGVLRGPNGGSSTLVSEDNRAHVQMRYGNPPATGGAARGVLPANSISSMSWDTGVQAGPGRDERSGSIVGRNDRMEHMARNAEFIASGRGSHFRARPIGRRADEMEKARMSGVLAMARMRGEREDRAAALAEQGRQFDEEVRQGVLDRRHDRQKTKYIMKQSQKAAEEADKRANAEHDRRLQASIDAFNKNLDAQRIFNEEERAAKFEQWLKQQTEVENANTRAQENARAAEELKSSKEAGFRQRNREGQARGFIANNPGRQFPTIDEYASWNHGDSDGYGMMLYEIDRQRRSARTRT